jgi:hypothetical protein
LGKADEVLPELVGTKSVSQPFAPSRASVGFPQIETSNPRRGGFNLTSAAIGVRLKENIISIAEQTTPSLTLIFFLELSMKKVLPPPLNHADWRTLYRAAILETNKGVLPKRVSEAEKAVLAREREVFYGHASVEEKEALEDALYALRAFRTAWQHSEAA